MKKINSVLLILTILLGACTTTAVPDTTSATDLPAGAESALSVREAILLEVENTVSARKTSADELITAEQGMSILESGSVETGEDGRVRVDLMPEGTIVRVGPNSAFGLPKLAEENGEPKTTIELLFGKVFVLLKGGTLSVETPSGVASVRGSLLSVEYDPETKRISAACMEGDCSLQAENGEETEIPEGEESFVDEGESPIDPFSMDQDEVLEWLEENPDLDLFMLDLPDPEDYTDWPDDFDGDMEGFPTDDPTEEAPTEFSPEDPNEGTPPPFEEEQEPEEEQPSEDPPPDDGGGEEG